MKRAVVWALTLAAGALAGTAAAQSFPAKSLRLVVPFPSGGFSDLLARLVGQKLTESVGQPVIVDNRAGAGGNIGADLVAKASPDGYTLLVSSLNYVINPSLMPPPFDPLKDLVGVSLVAEGPPLVMSVGASAPYRSVQDVVRIARSKPGQLNFATAGPGTSTHLAAEMFRNMTGVSIVLVPYKGGTAEYTAVMSGEAAVNFPLLPAVLPHLKGGRLQGLAVTSAKRIAAVPDLPTMAESGLAGFEINNFLGLMAPSGTPRPVLQKLQAEMSRIAAQRDFVERLEGYGMQPVAGSQEAFDRFIRQQMTKWAQVVRSTGAKAQ
jgi:tripartite-type tricarboxylate transporter receptor subunit TctC